MLVRSCTLWIVVEWWRVQLADGVHPSLKLDCRCWSKQWVCWSLKKRKNKNSQKENMSLYNYSWFVDRLPFTIKTIGNIIIIMLNGPRNGWPHLQQIQRELQEDLRAAWLQPQTPWFRRDRFLKTGPIKGSKKSKSQETELHLSMLSSIVIISISCMKLLWNIMEPHYHRNTTSGAAKVWIDAAPWVFPLILGQHKDNDKKQSHPQQ